MKYTTLVAFLILQLLLLQSTVCSGHTIKDEILKEVRVMLGEMENKLIFQYHARNDNDDLEDRVAILELQVENLEDQIAILKNEDSILDIRISDVEDDITSNQNSTEALDDRLSTVEDALVNLEIAIDDLANVDITLEQRIAELEATISSPWTACESSPCENGATCVDVNVDTFICLCTDGFFGVKCSNTYNETIFLATVEGAISPVPDPIPFNEVRLNPGGNYNNITSTYTAPFTGTYEFVVQVKAQPDNDFGAFLVSSSIEMAHSKTEGNAGYQSTGFSVLIPATSGQQFWIRPLTLETMLGTDARDGELNSWFSGHLINAD